MAFFHISYAQSQSLFGVLKSSKGEAVSFASVMVKDSDNKIVSFKSSDEKGEFLLTISVAQNWNDLRLEINHLGFKKISESLVLGKKHYEITLEEQSVNLADVLVKSRPRIISIGDTLTYNVQSFAKEEDRSIGDVLKRMPGMEVSENGKVKFNGQDISSLYIDGDDLLDDKYAIGTKTIPYAMVQGVEVLQNHQPIKVLRNKTISDRVALNLVIKDEAKLKLTGQAKVGLGLPNQYDGELNAILFNKKYKMLNVLKGNNIGDDLSGDFSGFNFSSFMSGMGNSRPSTLLSSGTAGSPSLPKNRYYFNQSGSLNANNLMNLKNGLQLKSNVKLLLDKNERAYRSTSEYYIGQDTIRYKEQQNLDNHPFIIDVSLQAKSNKEKYYFNNELAFKYSHENSYSTLLSNDMDMKQKLNNLLRDFSNTLDYVPELKNKNVMSIKWYLNYYNQPQLLTIKPGINADIFNEGNEFERLNQFAETPTWFSRASVGYRLVKNAIKQSYQMGVLNEFQKLNSQLSLTQFDGSEINYAGSPRNQLNWNRNQFFVDALYEYKKGILETTLSAPVTLQRIGYSDVAFDLNENKRKLLINPSWSMKLLMGSEDYISMNYGYHNQMGNINNIYRGAILENYRSLRANDAVLSEQNSHSIGLNYNFRRSINMLFMNAGMLYNRSSSNTIASNVIDHDISQTVLLSMVNNVSNIRANAGISKYIFALGATADLKTSWSSTRFNQLFNEELLPFNNFSFVVNPSVEARLWDRVSMTYNGTVSWTTSKMVKEESITTFPDRQVQSLDQTMGLGYSPIRGSFFSLRGKHQYSKQPQSQDINYFFIDAYAQYKITRWKADVELKLSNLANVKNYETYGISANHFLHNQYDLRGRMAILKFIFNL
jgi:hypothetical protein